MKTWFDDYVAAGGAANFDIVDAYLRGSANPPNSSPEAFLTMWDDVTTETAKRGLSKLPVWDDEYGIKKDQLTDPDMLAGFTARALILRAGVGVQRQFVYTWDANPPYGLQGSDSGTAWDVVAGWLLNHSISPCVAKGTVIPARSTMVRLFGTRLSPAVTARAQHRTTLVLRTISSKPISKE